MKKKLLLIITAFFVCFFQLNAAGQKESEKVSSSMEVDVDPFGVYEEPVTITVGMRTFGADQVPTEEGLWFKEYEKYGINVEVAWSADASQYDAKVNMAIASGDIPDVMFVNAGQQLTSLVRGDMVIDVDDYFEFLSPMVKEYLTEGVGAEALRSVTFDGKTKMLPANVSGLINNSFPLFVRKDWLDTLGMDLPETMDDFKEIAIAFAKDDPDQNGKDDTYGLAVMGKTNLIVDWGGLYGFFAGYGVQPCTWYDGMLFYSEDENGNAVWDGKKTEVKEGLQLLADLYEAGAIPADFPTMDGTRVTEDLTAGIAGMVFGVRGLPIWAFPNAFKTNENAEWYCVNMPVAEAGASPTLFAYQPVNVGYVISKECENPEAAIKMANITSMLKDPFSPDVDPAFTVDRSVTGDVVIEIINPLQEQMENELFFEAISNNDKSLCPPNLVERYDFVNDFINNKTPENWRWWNAFYPAPGHAWYHTFVVNTPEIIKKNVWWKLPSAKMNSKLPIYKKMAEETMTKIIMGIEPASEWDVMVANWEKLGGAEMTTEVQASLK
ncbi:MULTISPECIES: extracellular solute-binding protein [unclassified Oceanispirochaeta]|uniref:extracellular solute-binding protein n=1 Tax=unclassified Oceanispirochaeta TaxID=2635722 RepID=UPI0011C07697|nr:MULTISPECIES: extracellular solute-binding protein [unclassified Oceanispirochaeta]MBF9018918.1 extracellular solute-binding protein [Oceanispirochaeta sp. M2]NPD75417.1 extracellular solute-binding protein [Oceanispirochaeta sp. M1]